MTYLFILAVSIPFFVILGIYTFQYINKSKQGRTIAQIKLNPATASDYADALDFPYEAQTCEAAVFETLRDKLLVHDRIGKYRVRFAALAGPNRILLFTWVPSDVFFMRSDKLNNYEGMYIHSKAYHDFSVAFNPDKKEIRVFSTMYGNSTEKFQKDEILTPVMWLTFKETIWEEEL